MSEAGPHRWPVRVYYEDTDFSGMVYHANYLRFFERARTELLRAAGVSQSQLHGQGEAPGAFAVRSMLLDFAAAARMDDVLSVVSRVEALGGASITMRQAIERDGTVLVTATVRIALVAGGRAQRLPPSLRQALGPARSRRPDP